MKITASNACHAYVDESFLLRVSKNKRLYMRRTLENGKTQKRWKCQETENTHAPMKQRTPCQTEKKNNFPPLKISHCYDNLVVIPSLSALAPKLLTFRDN